MTPPSFCDTVGDPFQDTSSVALNPGDQVHHAIRLAGRGVGGEAHFETGGTLSHILAAAFFAVSFTFVYRSFYGMRIRGSAAQ